MSVRASPAHGRVGTYIDAYNSDGDNHQGMIALDLAINDASRITKSGLLEFFTVSSARKFRRAMKYQEATLKLLEASIGIVDQGIHSEFHDRYDILEDTAEGFKKKGPSRAAVESFKNQTKKLHLSVKTTSKQARSAQMWTLKGGKKTDTRADALRAPVPEEESESTHASGSSGQPNRSEKSRAPSTATQTPLERGSQFLVRLLSRRQSMETLTAEDEGDVSDGYDDESDSDTFYLKLRGKLDHDAESVDESVLDKN